MFQPSAVPQPPSHGLSKAEEATLARHELELIEKNDHWLVGRSTQGQGIFGQGKFYLMKRSAAAAPPIVPRPVDTLGQETDGFALSADGKWMIGGVWWSESMISDEWRKWAQLRLYDLSDEGKIRSYEVKSSAILSSAEISLDSRWLAIGSRNGTIQLVDLHGVKDEVVPMTLFAHVGSVTALYFTDQHLFSGAKDGKVKRWNLRRPTAAPVEFPGLDEEVGAITLSEDGSLLAAVGGQTAAVWNLDPKTLLREACASAGRPFSPTELLRLSIDAADRDPCGRSSH